jgi:hypothetical protein
MSVIVIKVWPKYLNFLGYNFIMFHTSRFKPAIPWRLSCPSYNACKQMAWCHWYPFRGSAWRCLMGCVVRMLEETLSWTGWGWHSADGAGPNGSKLHHLHGTPTWSDVEEAIQIPRWRPHIANLSCFSFLVWWQRNQPGVDVPGFAWDVQGHMQWCIFGKSVFLAMDWRLVPANRGFNLQSRVRIFQAILHALSLTKSMPQCPCSKTGNA